MTIHAVLSSSHAYSRSAEGRIYHHRAPVPSWEGMKSCRFSIVLVIIQQFLFAVDTTAIHWLGGSISLTQIGFLRSVGGMVLVLCLAPTLGWRVFHTEHPFLQAA